MKVTLKSAVIKLRFTLLVFLILGYSRFALAKIPDSERQALTAIFKSTQGDSWKNTEGWLAAGGKFGEPGTECDWKGVTCNDDESHIIGLSLSGLELNGPLPGSISSLQNLQTLDLSFNRLTGELPAGLFSLKYLETANLSQNRFRGSVPLTKAVLKKLKYLYLGGNYLRGTISIMGRFPALVGLDLSNNRFNGPLPTSVRFLTKLEMLDLQRNALTGELPAEIGELRSLKGLFLAHNHFSGRLPESIGNLRKLDFVDLSYNGLAGPLPATLRQLKNLRSLVAGHNAFEGYFPISVCHDSLSQLDLSANQFGGELPIDMSKCSSLQTLILADNSFRGRLSGRFFGAIADIQYLDLSANHFTGPIPASLGKLRYLSIINLSDNDFNGNLTHIQWPELRALHMDRNKFLGPIPKTLLADSLEELTLSSNRLNGDLPEGVCALVSLRLLDLSHNHLTGTLCDNIGDLQDVNIINLSYNQLKGTLPPSIGRLPNLTSLLLSHNSFTGHLPLIADLSALQVLDVSFNGLTGELPEWVGTLTILRSANLKNNAFRGGLAQLTKLKRLERLDITENNWSEALPQTLVNLQNAPAPALPMPLVDPRALVLEKNVQSPSQETVAEHPPLITVKEESVPEQVGPSLSGVIQDTTGAAVANATVSVESTSGTMNAKTDENGRFGFSVPEGSYHLTFVSPGFKSAMVDVSVKSHTAYSINVPLAVGGVSEVVEVSASVPETRQGLWWNSWITRRGTAEDSRITDLTSKQKKYSFYVELSGVSQRDQQNGDISVQLDQALQDRLAELLTEDINVTALFVRVSVIGRAAVLSTDVSSVAEWSAAGWAPTNGSTFSAVLDVDLPKLFPSLRPKIGDTGESANPSLARRGGAVRFGIDAVQRGCAVVAVSIWDETRSIPLDHLVHALSVDGQTGCSAEIGEQQAVSTLYSEASRGIMPDVSLQVFEYTLNGETHSASFMALQNPTSRQTEQDKKNTDDEMRKLTPCESYNWDSDATVIGLVLRNMSFKNDLAQARITDGVYSSLGEQITDAAFSSNEIKPCGSADALEALKTLAHKKDVRIFARITDENGRLAVAPLGLMAMFEQAGKPVFEHDIRLFQPIARESLSNTACVSSWLFVLPSELEGVNDKRMLEPPTALANDSRVVRSREAFIHQFVDGTPNSDNPSGLLLLAHHEDGVLRFSGSGDTMDFTQFKRDLGQGSIAVLSACETANLTQSTKFVGRLNQEGADALVAALFELPADFGIKFAFNFAQIVSKKENLPITLEDAFKKATNDTVADFSRTKGDRARGMGLELILVGNPKLQICAPIPAPPLH